MSLNCPLCHIKNYTIVYKNLPQYSEASIVKCNHCFHIYTLLNHEPEADKLYNDKVYKVIDNRDSLFDKILSWEYNRVIKKMNVLKPSKGSLLDFGSGKGKFGSLAKKNGWQVKCVETSRERAEFAKKNYELDVNSEYYSTGKIFNTDFDALTLFHVLEHLPSPKILLNELIKCNLKKDALVVIEVPNIKSLQALIAGNKWMHLDVPRHINHFSSIRMDQLANESGLVPLRTTFFSFHLGVLGMTDSFLKLFGYNENIIYQLKNKKSKILILSIALLLPFAFIIESFAAIIGRGGIIRKYFIQKQRLPE